MSESTFLCRRLLPLCFRGFSFFVHICECHDNEAVAQSTHTHCLNKYQKYISLMLLHTCPHSTLCMNVSCSYFLNVLLYVSRQLGLYPKRTAGCPAEKIHTKQSLSQVNGIHSNFPEKQLSHFNHAFLIYLQFHIQSLNLISVV